MRSHRRLRLAAALIILLAACICPAGTIAFDEHELAHHWRAR